MGKRKIGFLQRNNKKPVYHYKFGAGDNRGFVVDFYMKEGSLDDCYMEISAGAGVFNLKLQGYAYGYLMESARQGLTDNIHGFCAMLFLISDGVYRDAEFAVDLMEAIGGYYERLMERAEQKAEVVTDEQELQAQAVMEELAKFAELDDDAERDAMREEWKNDLRNEMARQDGDTTDNIPDA